MSKVQNPYSNFGPPNKEPSKEELEEQNNPLAQSLYVGERSPDPANMNYLRVFKAKNGKIFTTQSEVQAAAFANGGMELVDEVPM